MGRMAAASGSPISSIRAASVFSSFAEGSSGPWARKPFNEAVGSLPRRVLRVLILSWEYPPIVGGGLARHVRKLSEQLVRRGVEVHVLTRGGGHLPAEDDRHGVIVH